MSQQNIENQDHTDTDKPQQSNAMNQDELSAAIDKITFESKALPPIFKVYIDCWEEIFDWLPIEDIHSFGQTCKKFHRIAGTYFKWKYKRVLGHVYDHEMTIDWGAFNGFNEFTQRLSFYNSEPDSSLLYALANCKSPNELEIVNARSCELDIKPFESMLSRIEIMSICNIQLSGEFLESFLKPCESLKRLRIAESPGNEWMHQKYAKLEHLQMYECDPSQDNDLKTFFEQNPSVRSFSTSADLHLRNRDMFMASNIDVDDLGISRVYDKDLISIAVIDLHQRGFFKRLHFETCTADHLAQLPGLATLHVNTYDYIKIPPLPTVTALVFQALWNGLCSWMDMDEVSLALNNLERIITYETSADYMISFIRNSVKLKEIQMEYLRDDIDVLSMNNERKKLKGARKMIIYLEERDYLRLKWKYGKSDFDLIELKRKESYDGIWNPTCG